MVMMIEGEKTAVIDVGSNSVRLVVYYGAKRAPLQFFNEKVVCGLGRGLAQSGILHPEGRVRALNAIRRFAGIARRMDIKHIHTVATAAVRDATDGPGFCDDVLLETNLKLRVVTGKEEAALSAQGVFYSRSDAEGLVCDMGGSSMELASIADGEVLLSGTSSLGPLQLQNFAGDGEDLQNYIKAEISFLLEKTEPQETLYMIGGTIRSIANLDIALKAYPLAVMNEYSLPYADMQELLRWISKVDLEVIAASGAISSDRLDYVKLVAQVLLELLNRVKPKQVVFSSFGIREGVLYEQMPPRIQKRDPLIEACQFFEEDNARFKDFGTTLYAWLLPIFSSETDDRKRIIWAACLLHDVTWAAHPSYRAEVSFDYATRSNIAGLDHQERVFLAVALIYRYQNKPNMDKLDELNSLLSDGDQAKAESLGRAMRLGAMLGGPDIAHMGQIRTKGEVLELVLDTESTGLIGEVAGRRLQSLAKSLGKKAKMVIA
jgi:exopolyphosphatase/guanosine-5'-triphosphate,3'-diphosphate pyrophosphatase